MSVVLRVAALLCGSPVLVIPGCATGTPLASEPPAHAVAAPAAAPAAPPPVEIPVSTFLLTSPSFPAGGEIPREYTCQGADTSPGLAWTGAPVGTRSFALIEHDPDVPDPAAPQRSWVHWVFYDLPAEVGAVAEGVEPAGARAGQNDWGKPGYGGPCPPIGRHRYIHTLYALDSVLGDRGLLTRAELEGAMSGHVLAKAELVGTYQKSR